MGKSIFIDGLTNVFNSIINRRAGSSNEFVDVVPMSFVEQRNIYRTGLGNKIVRLKAGHALKDTLQFEASKDRKLYEEELQKHVKKAAKFMLAFGRGIVVIFNEGDDLSKPLGNFNRETARLHTFSGDMVRAGTTSWDLSNPRYYKPVYYNVRGYNIHYSRVIDFTYVEPPEDVAARYDYGGISEFELIREQIINDGRVERASGHIIEKNSNWIYKLEGFKDALRSKQDDGVIEYVSKSEDMRSIYGATIIDAADSVESIDQTLTNLSEVDQITLRRLAMVTGIPVSVLVGESVRGLNSSGDNERTTFQDTVEVLQSDYLLEPINDLLKVFGCAGASFKDNQGQTPGARIKYESEVVKNAQLLWQMGEDHEAYLREHDIGEKDDFESFFADPEEERETPEPPTEPITFELP